MELLIVGGGPGGYVAAVRAAQLGAKVTLVEKGELGGTCLQVGCIPTKVLLHATELYESIGSAAAYGISVSGAAIDCAVLQAYKTKTVRKLTGGVGGLMRANNITVHKGTASFLDAGHVRVTAENGAATELSFDKAVVATGSVTASIPIPGADLPCVVTSDEALSFIRPPASMVIIGGGVIGVELATVYARLGAKITIVEALERILPNMDAKLTALMTKQLKAAGIAIHTSCRVSAIEQDGTVRFSGAQGEQSAQGEKVLMAVGRKPNTQGMGLESLGVRLERGAIQTDAYMRTNCPGIYAIGDSTGGMMLAHVASEQGVVAVENAIKGDIRRYDSKTVPGCIYTDPELASVGLTEDQARQRYRHVKTGKFNLAANGKTMLMGSSGLIKFVVDGDTDEILGLHILGPRATDMIVEGALALRLEATIEEIVTTIHAHPTIAEGIQEAANDALGLCIHKH